MHSGMTGVFFRKTPYWSGKSFCQGKCSHGSSPLETGSSKTMLEKFPLALKCINLLFIQLNFILLVIFSLEHHPALSCGNFFSCLLSNLALSAYFLRVLLVFVPGLLMKMSGWHFVGSILQPFATWDLIWAVTSAYVSKMFMVWLPALPGWGSGKLSGCWALQSSSSTQHPLPSPLLYPYCPSATAPCKTKGQVSGLLLCATSCHPSPLTPLVSFCWKEQHAN